MPQRSYYTSPAGRIVALLGAVLLLLLALVLTRMSFDTVWAGHTVFRVRRGGRISIDGWRAYLHAFAGLLFALYCLTVSICCIRGALTPERFGPDFERFIAAARVFLLAAGAAALTLALSLFFR